MSANSFAFLTKATWTRAAITATYAVVSNLIVLLGIWQDRFLISAVITTTIFVCVFVIGITCLVAQRLSEAKILLICLGCSASAFLLYNAQVFELAYLLSLTINEKTSCSSHNNGSTLQPCITFSNSLFDEGYTVVRINSDTSRTDDSNATEKEYVESKIHLSKSPDEIRSVIGIFGATYTARRLRGNYVLISSSVL